MSHKNQNDNLIQFPRERVAPSNVVELPVTQARSPKSPKKWIWGSLAAVFLATCLLNSVESNTQHQLSTHSRSLASVGINVVDARDTNLEKKLAKKLSNKLNRVPASFGNQPSKVEEFKYGFLQSNYSVRSYQGKVLEVEFSKAEGTTTQPRYLTNRTQFLQKNKDLFPAKFSSAVSVNREVVDKKVLETYALLNESQAKVGQIFFKLDIHGRLLGLKVSSLQ